MSSTYFHCDACSTILISGTVTVSGKRLFCSSCIDKRPKCAACSMPLSDHPMKRRLLDKVFCTHCTMNARTCSSCHNTLVFNDHCYCCNIEVAPYDPEAYDPN